MRCRDLFPKEISIRITDDDVGFVYSVKYAGVRLWHGFVPALSAEEGAGEKLTVRRGAAQPDERDDHAR